MGKLKFCLLVLATAATMAACGGGSNSGSSAGTSPPPPQSTPDSGCSGFCANASSYLSEADVQTIIAQAVNEAQAQGKPAVITVIDRVGNVLGVYRMANAPATVRITDPRPVTGGLIGLDVPPELAAISKAITAVYFSSEGNAFTSRTAGQIAQEHFNQGDLTSPAGPLFGVQISNLPCSDINTRFTGNGTNPGTHRAPLGLSPDPGGISLYKAGVPVGAVGVSGAKGTYTLDLNAEDRDRDVDETIAVAGSFGFIAPADRRADQITAGGLTLQYANTSVGELARNPASAPPFSSLTAASGELIAVPGYAKPVVLRGTAFGQPESGVRPDTTEWPGLDAFVVVDADNKNRFPPRDGTDGANALTAAEVRAIIGEGIKLANRTRAQVRRPLGSPAGETIVVSDTNGVVLGIGRSRDALVDAIDVTTQKARTAAFFSGAYAAADIQAAGTAKFFTANVDSTNKVVTLTTTSRGVPADYVAATRSFLGSQTAFGDGAIAYSNRAIGLLGQPLYPSGIPGAPNGPLALPLANWSPFKTGLELDLAYNQIALSIAYIYNQNGYALNIDGASIPAPSAANPEPLPDVRNSCTDIARLPSGFSLFPGSVPIYRGKTLVGGIGASGDGSDQSDLVAFLALSNGAAKLPNSGLGQAPASMRADTLAPLNSRLLYVQCPQAPFIDTNDANACGGK